jgi:hypothetical protein
MRDGHPAAEDIIVPDANGDGDMVHFCPNPLLFFIQPPSSLPSVGTMEKKITEKIAALPPDANYFSLEFFPPKTRMVG